MKKWMALDLLEDSDASSRTDQACLNHSTSARHTRSEDWACMQGATRFGDSLQGHANMAMSPPPHPPSIYPQVGLL